MDINTEGIQALILTFIKSLANLDLKALDFDFSVTCSPSSAQSGILSGR